LKPSLVERYRRTDFITVDLDGRGVHTREENSDHNEVGATSSVV